MECNISNKRFSKQCHWFTSTNDICVHEHVIKPSVDEESGNLSEIIQNHIENDMKKHCVSPESKIIFEFCCLGPNLGIPITTAYSIPWTDCAKVFQKSTKMSHVIHKHCGRIDMDYSKWIWVNKYLVVKL